MSSEMKFSGGYNGGASVFFVLFVVVVNDGPKLMQEIGFSKSHLRLKSGAPILSIVRRRIAIAELMPAPPGPFIINDGSDVDVEDLANVGIYGAAPDQQVRRHG